MTPVQSIRKYCLDCCCGSPKEVRLCPCKDCFLYTFRLGTNSNFLKENCEKVKEYHQTSELGKQPSYLGDFDQRNKIRG